MDTQTDPLEEARRRGKNAARKIFKEMNRLSANTRAANLGTLLKARPRQITLNRFFERVVWPGCPEDIFDRMDEIIPGLGRVAKRFKQNGHVYGTRVPAIEVLDFFLLTRFEQLGGKTPQQAWDKKNLRGEIMRRVDAHFEHGAD